jgi:enamine deaminase RidA (YjgF/YER057c/UK114 family)
MQMKSHDPSAIFAPVGSYTHGLEVVEAHRLLFITGTMGLDKNGKAPVGIEAQCALAWRNIGAILEHAG